MISIGVVSKPHGIKGEVRVHPFQDCSDIFRTGRKIVLNLDGIETEAEIIQLRSHSGVFIVKFNGVDDRNGAESLRGAECLIKEDDIPEREDGSFYAFQLIGLEAQNLDGRYIGIINDVLESPGQRLIVIDADGREVLIPEVPEFVKELDLKSGCIKIAPIEGLLD